MRRIMLGYMGHIILNHHRFRVNTTGLYVSMVSVSE